MSNVAPVSAHSYYNRPQLFGPGSAYDTPIHRNRGVTVAEHLPPGTRTLLDVGCGDGTITNILAAEYDVVGVDIAEARLDHVRAPTRVASAADLPFSECSFDAVVLLEILEHLEGDEFRSALLEAARVARRSIVVTVPNRENLRQTSVRCQRCGTRFSPWRHQRRFSPRSLRNLFPEFDLELVREFGPPQAWVSSVEAWVTRAFDRRPLIFPALCPNCGLEGESPPSRPSTIEKNYLRSLVSRSQNALRFAFARNRWLRPGPRPRWLLARFTRVDT
jgi:SAM-dependent methyltransferase